MTDSDIQNRTNRLVQCEGLLYCKAINLYETWEVLEEGGGGGVCCIMQDK